MRRCLHSDLFCLLACLDDGMGLLVGQTAQPEALRHRDSGSSWSVADYPKTAARSITSRPIPDVVITWHQLDAELLCRISSERYPTTKIDPQTWSAESLSNLFDVTHEDAVCVVRRGKLSVSVSVPAGFCCIAPELSFRRAPSNPPPTRNPNIPRGSTADMMLSLLGLDRPCGHRRRLCIPPAC